MESDADKSHDASDSGGASQPSDVEVPHTMDLSNSGKKETRLFAFLCGAATWSSGIILVILLVAVAYKSRGWIDWQFLTSYDSRRPEKAGIFAGLVGTTWMIFFTILFSVPLGVGAAIYLEEYARDNWLSRLIRINLSNLAGVPSIVYGILGVTVFVRSFGMFGPGGYLDQWFGWDLTRLSFLGVTIPLPLGEVVLSGAMTMTLLILPVVIIASQEALRAVPPSIRHASIALGATKWQTIRNQVLPAAVPGIMTGVILSISRAIGETAPLICLGIAAYVPFAPGGIDSPSRMMEHPEGMLQAPFDYFTVVPIQIYNWALDHRDAFKGLAAAGICVLLAMLLFLNGVAILIRNYSNRHIRW